LSARGISGEYALGDPGLLANELVGPQEKQWDLGIVPHWTDTELAERFQKLMPAKYSTKVIDPKGDPLEVIRQIGASRRIVTSSLHGMIVADAFGLMRRVEICPSLASEGGTFKFRDYSASIQTPFETGKMMAPRRGPVENLQHEIYDAYKALGASIK
jgi:pyruvyltransferase